MNNETLTNIFWGLFFIWIGVVAAFLKAGDLLATFNDKFFALGTGLLLLAMNLVRSTSRLKVSTLTVGLGALLTIFYAPLALFGISVPFLPALVIILGVALIIGALRTRNLF